MAILPVTSVGLRSNAQVNFGRRKNEGEDFAQQTKSSPRQASKMVTIPLSLLMSLTTMSLDAKEPGNTTYDKNLYNTEIVAEDTPQNDEKIKVKRKTIQERRARIENNRLSFDYQVYYSEVYDKVIVEEDFKSQNGKKYTMVYSSNRELDESNPIVDWVELIPYDYKAQIGDTDVQTPLVRKLVYHNIGKDKEYCGLWVNETRSNANEIYSNNYEIPVPDEIANMIIDLFTKKKSNDSRIEFMQTTSPDLLEPTTEVLARY